VIVPQMNVYALVRMSCAADMRMQRAERRQHGAEIQQQAQNEDVLTHGASLHRFQVFTTAAIHGVTRQPVRARPTTVLLSIHDAVTESTLCAPISLAYARIPHLHVVGFLG
jgi:hypothetical protein